MIKKFEVEFKKEDIVVLIKNYIINSNEYPGLYAKEVILLTDEEDNITGEYKAILELNKSTR